MAASITVGAIENYIVGFEDSAYKQICHQLISREVCLVDVTEKLGAYLTNKDTTVRARGTHLLAEILNHLPADFLSQKEGGLLTNYLCERLQDHHSLQPHALYGLQALSCSSNLSEECVETICRTIFKEVHCQSLAQADRRTIFTIISTFLQTKLTELQKLGTDFVYGFIQVMDGEKDPRNLISAFHCARIVIENFPLGVFTEEMFEVVSCYFPIDFKPSETDPSGITQEDLIKGLRHVLAATPQFAQYCLPLLMEKLTSDLKSAKIDSLQTLAICAEVYGSPSIQEFQSSFFNCIKKEVFLSGDTVVEEAALKALTALVRTLSTGVIETGTKGSLEGFVQEILTEVKQHLLEPELMLMLSTGRLLQAVAQGSSAACCQVLDTTIPMLTETHSKQTEATPKYNVLQVMNGIIDSIAYFTQTAQCVTTIKQFQDQVMNMYMSAIKENVPMLQQQAVQGFKALFTVKDLLTLGNMSSIGKTLILKVLEADLDREVRSKCNEFFQFISRIQPGVVLEALKFGVFPLVFPESQDAVKVDMHKSRDKDVEMDDAEDNKMSIDQEIEELLTHTEKWFTDSEQSKNNIGEFPMLTNEEKSDLLKKNIDILETLSAVCVKVVFIKVVTRVLLLYLFHCKDSSVETCHGIFQCFVSIVDEANNDIESLQYLYTNIVPAIYNWIITHYHIDEWRDRVRDEVLLKHIAAFLRKTVTYLTRKNDRIFPSAYSSYCVSVYLDRNFRDIVLKFLPNGTSVLDQQFSPLQQEKDAIYTCLLTPVLCSGPPEMDIPRGKEFMDKLSALSETVTDVSSHSCVVKCLAGLVNKWKNEEELNHLLQHITHYIETTLQSEVEKSRKDQAVQYWAWITKALVLRNHNLAASFTNKLLDLLADTCVGKEAAAGIATILTPCDDVLTKEMSANIRIMYRQRFFMENLPKLAQGFESSAEGCKKNYLLAASHLITNMNKQVLVPELNKVFPLLIHSLQFEDIDLQLSTMLTLVDLIQNAPELVHKQMDSLIPKLLKLTTYKPSMKVRIAALKCIEEMTTLPPHIVMPYRGQITRALESALDDRKRLVRKQAVSARQEWYLLDTKSK